MESTQSLPSSATGDVPLAPPSVCSEASKLGDAALGRLSSAERESLDRHLLSCEACARARHELVEEVAAWGHRLLYKSHLKWQCDMAWMAPYKKYIWPDGAQGKSILRIIDRRFTLSQMARGVARLRGSTAECGVLHGVGSAVICKTLENTYRDGEHHFGFDSFEGLSEPAAIDRSKYAWQEKGALAVPAKIAKHLLADFPFCRLVKGWVPECLGPAEGVRFRLVHLDMDLYQPTIDALAFFYPRLEPGGIFALDDYGHITCLGVRAAVDEFFADKPETVLETVDGIGYAYKT